MRNLKQIQEELSVYNLSAVSRDLGVHSNSLYGLMKNKNSPSYALVERLDKYISNKKRREKREEKLLTS